MKTTLVLLFGFLLFLGCKDSTQKDTKMAPETETGEPSWEPVAAQDGSKPVKRHEAAFVEVGDKFYLLGGRGIRPVSIYDPGAGTWSQGSAPPLELHHFQPIVHQNQIYVIAALTGGWPNETPTTHIYRYDPVSDEWMKGNEIPEDRRRGSTGNVLHKGKIYISCGIKNGHIGDHKNWMDRYDPDTGEWEVLTDAPRARDHFQSVLVEGKIYNLAGRNTGKTDDPFGGTIDENDVYDIASDSWETLPNNVPTPRAGNAAILYKGKIVVAGGESPTQEKAHSEVESLDPKTHEWKALPNLLGGRHGTGLLEYEASLYIASGCGNRGGEPELSTMERYTQ